MSVDVLQPGSDAEVAECLRSVDAVRIVGQNSRSFDHEIAADVPVLDLSLLTGIVDLHPADLTVSVRAGTPMAAIQAALAEHRLCLPTEDELGTVGGAYMMNLEYFGRRRDRWQDWVLGAKYMFADGTVAKSGSHAVKSVAGYDVHRFMAGTRGSLLICLELILRAYPLAAKPETTVSMYRDCAPRTPDRIFVAEERLMKRAKAIFDPSGKLNPGEWGFM